MRHLLTPLLWIVAAVLRAQPICQVAHYDEFNGLSQRLVKQIVQDGDGMLWMATWNGLNRFDGYAFTTVKPRVGSGQPVSSDRINDIRLMATGNLWCRVDNRLMVFDTRAYRFIDIHAALERQLRRRLSIHRLLPTTGATTAMQLTDGSYLVLSDRQPTVRPRLHATLPPLPYVKASNLRHAELGATLPSPLVYACPDRYGTIWVVTRDGDIYYTPSPVTPLTRYAQRIDTPEPLLYSLTDRQGNVWLHNGYGAYRLSFGRHPYTTMPQEQATQVRCLYRDRQGRVWVTGRDDTTVRLFSGEGKSLGYLTPTGTLTQGYTRFGRAVYCMTEDRQGHVWLGCKPDGLLRLTERTKGTFSVEQFRHSADAASLPSDNVYDLCTDRQGRLWVGTMKGGLCCLADPTERQPRFLTVGNTFRSYPREAMAVRRIVVTTGGAMLIATTGGLVVADSRVGDAGQMTFRLHVGEPDRAASLGCVALMDILEDSRHRVFIASESGGVSQVTNRNLLDRQLRFRHFTAGHGLSSDIALSLFEHGGRLWVVGNSQVMALRPDSTTSVTYGATFWERPIRFSDAHPLHLGGGRWLLGLQDGCMTVDIDSLDRRERYVPPVVLTAISVENRADSVAVSRMDTLTLQPDERNLTVRFAALDYADADQLHYAFRLGDDGPWNDIGLTRSVTLLDLRPGTYRLALRSTDSRGQWLDNVRTLTVIVTPTFWETGWAHALYVLAVLLVLAAIGRTIAYIRAIKRKQRDTLEAYLKLQEERHGTPQPTERPALSDEDAQFMQRVTAFMEAHLADAEASVNDMAAAAAVSRSGLNRRLKAIVGVTPAEFMRETRLQRAATLLATTDRTVSEIALDCGFSDQNYFGKCFKARRGQTPSDYRRQTGER